MVCYITFLRSLFFSHIVSSILGRIDLRSRPYDVHNPIASRFKGTQESRQHRGSLPPRVVKQDDSSMGRLEATEHLPELLARRHRIPVTSPKIGAEYDDISRRQAIQQL